MRFNLWLLFSVACLAACAGCTTSNSQLATCQAEKEQLLTTIRGQRDATRALDQQVASLESRLDQAEKELARGGSATRFSSLPSRPNESSPAVKSESRTPIKSESLPWRVPGGKGEASGPQIKDGTRAGVSSTAARDSLVALARRDRRVRYDATTRAAEIETPIQFDNNSATLSAEGKRQLDDLSRLLRSEEARDLRIVVAGGSGRAQAVADYLDRHGIPDERLSVSSASKPAATGDSEKLAASGGVQVFLLDPDASVATWGAKPLRR